MRYVEDSAEKGCAVRLEKLHCVPKKRLSGVACGEAGRTQARVKRCRLGMGTKGFHRMETMWAPWRMEYILGDKEDGCIFCKALSADDDLTLYKGRLTMVVMNKFPYINGHLLVAPIRHVSGLDHLGGKEKEILLSTVDKAVAILKEVMNPDGFNIGVNLGRVAGAGVEEHLHFHIVPRWFGDVNSLTVFADVRVIPEHIKATFNNLKPFFDKLEPFGD